MLASAVVGEAPPPTPEELFAQESSTKLPKLNPRRLYYRPLKTLDDKPDDYRLASLSPLKFTARGSAALVGEVFPMSREAPRLHLRKFSGAPPQECPRAGHRAWGETQGAPRHPVEMLPFSEKPLSFPFRRTPEPGCPSPATQGKAAYRQSTRSFGSDSSFPKRLKGWNERSF
jgi:hypothetical protein